jgi:hypothetical protein
VTIGVAHDQGLAQLARVARRGQDAARNEMRSAILEFRGKIRQALVYTQIGKPKDLVVGLAG